MPALASKTILDNMCARYRRFSTPCGPRRSLRVAGAEPLLSKPLQTELGMAAGSGAVRQERRGRIGIDSPPGAFPEGFSKSNQQRAL